MPSITSTGLGSGLDIKSMVTSLVQAEGASTTKLLDMKEARLSTQISSYGSLQSSLSSFQTSLSSLKNLSSFQQISVSSSDSSTLTATATSNADLASYSLEVKQLAKSQSLVSPVFALANSTVGTGTLTIKLGTTTFGAGNVPTGFTQNGNLGTLTLTIDPTNNTLAGLSNAINAAKAGVTAAVVTDNSGSRLVLSSTQTGTNSSMEISVTDTGDGNNTDASGLSALAFNVAASNMTQVQAAQDSTVAINGLDVVSSTNTVNTAIKGLTFNLLQAQPGKIITVGVTQNNDNITTAINGFVKSYNDLIKLASPMTAYDASAKKAGPLQGDSTITLALSSLRSKLGSVVSGLNGTVKALADIGITTQRDGTLVLDSTKLTSQLAANHSGVTGLFAVAGRPSASNVLYSSSTTDTKAGQYAVNITQYATQGLYNSAAPTSLTIGAGVDSFAISVDGTQSGTISLTQKTYASYADLAVEMQSRINSDSALKANGISVGVTYDGIGNKMVITSKSYGSASQVNITANTTTTLGLGIGAGIAGLDVIGQIDGSFGTGVGQSLTSTTGNSKGLNLTVTDAVVGSNGTVDFSRGLMESLNKSLTGMLSTTGTLGTITTHQNSLKKSLDSITAQRTKLATHLTQYQAQLYTKYNNMDRLLGKMQSTGSYLQQQFNPTTKN